jgi:hypothetical protein
MSRRFSKKDEQRKKIVQRVQEIIDDTYNTEAEFLKEMKMAPGTFGNLKDKHTLTIEFLIEFAEKHKKSLDWIIRKIGQKDLSPSEAAKPTE